MLAFSFAYLHSVSKCADESKTMWYRYSVLLPHRHSELWSSLFQVSYTSKWIADTDNLLYHVPNIWICETIRENYISSSPLELSVVAKITTIQRGIVIALIVVASHWILDKYTKYPRIVRLIIQFMIFQSQKPIYMSAYGVMAVWEFLSCLWLGGRAKYELIKWIF